MNQNVYKYFLGRYKRKTDSRARLRVPNKILKIIETNYPKDVMILNEIYIERDNKEYVCIEAVPSSLYDKEKEKKRFIDGVISASTKSWETLDEKKRLLIPDEMKGNVKIYDGTEVMILGNLESFLIFEYEIGKEFYNKYKSRNKPITKIK